MAQYQVYRLSNGDLVVDLQSDMVQTSSRVVARLVPEAELGAEPPAVAPVFAINGERMVLFTPQMAAISGTALREPVDDLSAQSYAILRAVDLIFTGV